MMTPDKGSLSRSHVPGKRSPQCNGDLAVAATEDKPGIFQPSLDRCTKGLVVLRVLETIC